MAIAAVAAAETIQFQTLIVRGDRRPPQPDRMGFPRVQRQQQLVEFLRVSRTNRPSQTLRLVGWLATLAAALLLVDQST